MSPTWYSTTPPPPAPSIGPVGWVRVGIKGILLGALVFGGLLVLLLLRLIERPLFGAQRPLTPFIAVFVCRNALRIIGLTLHTVGGPAKTAGALVANHSSWLDIFVLNATTRAYFVSKAEVAAWPGIGWLARATGTVFIERSRAKAAQQALVFAQRLGAGHRLLFFPEGTSSDGLRVLPFKSSLFAAFFVPELHHVIQVQPVSLRYTAPEGADPRFYGWWGDMEFGPHLLMLLAAPQHGQVEVVYHTPLAVAACADRKTLAQMAETAVRSGHTA
ncbi:1-acyl-sn-glycerol-3-phosphate acyltransferase [Roseobacter denitrificans]|uniref:Acyltransferase n=1 Tax=Roseobacter denitrificans (strain ATCC 33942 / OCh 114) TaxID=375451 RepID=Q165Z1_ROSDO|nr:lysophospholipid acyltransferase family protein [Roseobacter denitrificans]ABG32202.1 acyltransferase [Roseobacter denitrificans OCh 114]AVL51697.1 1-acyl-sn-glycerol-3-phosphate acyltransferase [Roseobacter denitrificans]SFF78618.1 lyso-ornithine lipid acyltransferase [Roseobacter denitrificans OCh 114]